MVPGPDFELKLLPGRIGPCTAAALMSEFQCGQRPTSAITSQTVSGSAATSTSPVANNGALASACTGSSCFGQPAASWRSASDDLVQAGMGAVLDGRGRRPELGLANGGLECLGTLVAADVDEPEVGLGRQVAV